MSVLVQQIKHAARVRVMLVDLRVSAVPRGQLKFPRLRLCERSHRSRPTRASLSLYPKSWIRSVKCILHLHVRLSGAHGPRREDGIMRQLFRKCLAQQTSLLGRRSCLLRRVLARPQPFNTLSLAQQMHRPSIVPVLCQFLSAIRA